MRKGVPISPGIAVAPAFRFDHSFSRSEVNYLDTSALSEEIRHFSDACAAATAEIEEIAKRVHDEVGPSEAAIFKAHKLLLQDPTLIAKVQTAILNRRVDASTAVHDVLEEYTQLFSLIQDESLKERLSDLRDVLGRVMHHLQNPIDTPGLEWDEPVIIVAQEILPSQAMALHKMQIAGIVTEVGGPSGHAAILARALGIPAVSGLEGLLQEINDGDLMAVDGREGHIYLHPGPEVETAYRKLQREYVHLRDQMIANRDHDAISADGCRVELLANVNNPADAVTATNVGAKGVGLYRTEFLFLAHPSVPTEEEQYEVYKSVIEAAPNKTVTIRTLDLGGDKHVPYLGEARESNPFMGWRSIRMISAHPEFFQTQLRAILRAGLLGNVSLLFPMISILEEILRLKQLVNKVKKDLSDRGVAFAENIPLGVMIEVPSAALNIHAILQEIDFVSIGSNDLIQYVMAADRDNPKVAHLCEPFNPAILKILNHVIKACVQNDKPVTLCGEMAGRPRCFLPLFGMGLRRFSMSPAFVPTIKELLLCTRKKDAEDIAQSVLKMSRIEEVRSYLTEKIKSICPNVAQLDTSK